MDLPLRAVELVDAAAGAAEISGVDEGDEVTVKGRVGVLGLGGLNFKPRAGRTRVCSFDADYP
jgi:hypothetical protein